MEGLNEAFFNIIDKIMELQVFFRGVAWSIGRTALLIALLTAGFNYAISGGGLKENIVKISKALVFFVIVMSVYPRIVGAITTWTFNAARQSTYASVETVFMNSQRLMAERARAAKDDKNKKKTYIEEVAVSPDVSPDLDPEKFFINPLTNREFVVQRKDPSKSYTISYTVVAPAALLRLLLVTAGECLKFSDNAPKSITNLDFGAILKGFICAFFVIATGIFGILEYVIAFLEFMLVSSVGVK